MKIETNDCKRTVLNNKSITRAFAIDKLQCYLLQYKQRSHKVQSDMHLLLRIPNFKVFHVAKLFTNVCNPCAV